jgi:hypothetical protein
MAMDRVARIEATLSNTLKRMSDTAEAILENLKWPSWRIRPSMEPLGCARR